MDEVGTPLMSSADAFNVFITRQNRTLRTVRTIQRFYSLILLQREIKLNTFSWRGERGRLVGWQVGQMRSNPDRNNPVVYSPET